MARLLIASNRLPVTVQSDERGFSVTLSSGGLATGLRGVCSERDVRWIGWPGDVGRLSASSRRQLEEVLGGYNLQPIELTRREVRGYYEDVANGVLWPVFHDQINQLSPEMGGWDDFVAVNERFAQAISEQYQEGDAVWVQDYHLCLVPMMLRTRLPHASIGFFLHIPFPSKDLFSVLPWREQILTGMLGADLIGFHTEGYRDNFLDALGRLTSASIRGDEIAHPAGRTTAGVYPMGIDAEAWSARAEGPAVSQGVQELRRDANGRSLLVGIDRLDYTKGILRRCLAVERLLSMEEDLAESLRFIQVTVPSRTRVEAYTRLGRDIDETVGRINATHSSASAVPIHRIHRSLSEDEVSVLYRAADVMLVTPLRDGMNLVAKEFVASRTDEDGVLVLSEFTGAALELDGALKVNPYDVDGTASVILQALTMPQEEQQRRMRSMRERVFHQDVKRWKRSFLNDLETVRTRSQVRFLAPTPSRVGRGTARVPAGDQLVYLDAYGGRRLSAEG
jgi:trehalose 6-phosphate synthase/phosphatase